MADGMEVEDTAANGPAHLELVRGAGLAELIQAVNGLVSKRAYAIYETRGREDGHDVEDWLQAEFEQFHSSPIGTGDFADHLIVFVPLLGVGIDEVKVGIEPRRVIVLERSQHLDSRVSEPTASSVALRVLKLACEIDPGGSLSRWTVPSWNSHCLRLPSPC